MGNMKELINEVKSGVNSTKDPQEIVDLLLKIHNFLPNVDSGSPIEEKQCFIRDYYVRFLYFLLENVDSSWESSWNDDQLVIFDDFFLKGISSDSLLVLITTIGDLKPSYKLEKCVSLVETIINPKNMSETLISLCKLDQNPFAIHESTWNELITVIISLPERLANKLQRDNRLMFYPDKYFTNLSSVIVITLKTVANELREERNCSLQFLSRLFGRCCAVGQADAVLSCILRHLIRNDDFIWRRMCRKFLLGIPDKYLENMLSSLVKLAPNHKLMEVVLGDAVLTNNKLKMLLTQKFLLLRTFDDDKILRNILGYLNEISQENLISVFKTLLNIWGDKMAVKKTALSQHVYITRALLISAGKLKSEKLNPMRAELIVKLMDGVSCHLDSPHESIRLIGMVTAECLTQLVDPNSPAMKFEYHVTDETTKLKSLIEPDDDSNDFDVSFMDEITERLEKVEFEKTDVKVVKNEDKFENLDSDDDLEPFDMSNDKPITKFKKPHYLRDCLEGLIDQSNPDRTEICLQTAEHLIRNERDLSDELAVEVALNLLHLENNCCILNYTTLCHQSLVAVLVCSPIKVASYLTHQFYQQNYTIRQRLDILQALSAAAHELSQPLSDKPQENVEKTENLMQFHPKTEWREIIDKRIEKKTKYYHKTKPKILTATPNRFAPVAGYFFFDLMRNYDDKRNTFKLLDGDCILLGRLLHTLGSVIYYATNAPIVPQMARSLLDFTLALRFHNESQIRKGVLFCFSMILLSVPSHLIYQDFQVDFLEFVQWLQHVVSNDPDQECRYLANQTLLLSQKTVTE